MKPQIKLIRSLINEVESSIKYGLVKRNMYLELLIGDLEDSDKDLSLSDKITLLEYSVKLIEKLEDSEKRLQYYQKILDIDQNAKPFVYFQAAKYFEKRDNKEHALNYLNLAFESLKDKKDMLIKKEDAYKMADMFIEDFNEIDKGLDCVQLANELEKEKGKNLFKDYLKILGDILKPKH